MKIIGLDLGGTFIKCGLLNEKGEISAQWKVASPTGSLEDLLAALDECVKDHLADADGIAVSVGDGVPSGVGLGSDIVPRAVIGGGGSDLLAGIRPRQRGTRGVARHGLRAQLPEGNYALLPDRGEV